MIFFFFSIAPPLVLESMRAREQLRRLQEEKISMIFLLLILSQRYINYWEKQCHVGCPYSEGKAIKPTKLNLGAKKITLLSPPILESKSDILRLLRRPTAIFSHSYFNYYKLKYIKLNLCAKRVLAVREWF